MAVTVKFAKCREGAIIPSKRAEDAGFDIYPCFDGLDNEFIVIGPNETVLVPTGICSAFDKDYVFVLKERGSTGSKGIGQRAGIIDSGFRGEWMVPVTNHSKETIIIGDKVAYKDSLGDDLFTIVFGDTLIDKLVSLPKTKAICQALLLPVPEVEIEECAYNEIQNIKSERMGGMLGSSGK